jgi:hypothetical protein
VATILYARVSTVDQTIAHQEAQARKAGFTIDQVVSDHGVSGVRVPLSERPEGRRLFDMLRSGDTCQSASKIGSDSNLMKLGRRLALNPKRNHPDVANPSSFYDCAAWISR